MKISFPSFCYLKANSLTLDQKEFVQRALAEFEPHSLSNEDVNSIVEAFAEAGIKPGRELFHLLAKQGFSQKIFG